MRIQTAGMTNWLRRELVVTELGLEWDEWQFRRLVKRMLPFSQVAHVEVLWGPFGDDLQVTGRDATDSVLIRGLDKACAQRIRSAIERRLPASIAA
ncbi:MAG TPA: hypothetical protein VK009_16655 [Chloroflexota bacterium]|nr:hypothetical protein [Chloroflexota bacterium]